MIELYRDRLERVYPEDSPVLFWLRPIISEAQPDFARCRSIWS
jgi:hypothetical protein